MSHVPDYRVAARTEAAALQANPASVQAAEAVAAAECPGLDRKVLLAEVEAFHIERMQKRPPAATYPEAQPWVDFAIQRDALLQEITGISLTALALRRSLGQYLCFRGRRRHGASAGRRAATTERCRVAYVPQTDRGQLHIKNVDDPLTYWRPAPPATRSPFAPPLVWDGVGNGMFIDDEPEQIFPLPVVDMWRAHCSDVAGSIEFLTRYSPFLGGMSMVIHDFAGQGVAIDKPSYNFLETTGPSGGGGWHVSGNNTRDPQSPLGQYFLQNREEYAAQINMPDDAPDRQFWANCKRADKMLADVLAGPAPLSAQAIIDLFITFWPQGLNKDGIHFDPQPASTTEYTLMTHIDFMDEKRYLRYQRDAAGRWIDQPDVVMY